MLVLAGREYKKGNTKKRGFCGYQRKNWALEISSHWAKKGETKFPSFRYLNSLTKYLAYSITIDRKLFSGSVRSVDFLEFGKKKGG